MKRLTLFSMLSCLFPVLTSCNVNTEPPDMQVMRDSRPIDNTKEFSVDLKYDVGQLEITRATDDKLVSFDLQYDKRRYDPKFTFDPGDRASMRLDTNGHGSGGLNGGHSKDNDLTLRLSDKVSLDLNIAMGVSESHMEMTGLQVHRMHLRGGVGKTEVTFDKAQAQPMESFEVESGVGELIIHGLGNTQVGHVDLKGGVGHTELDFTGELGMARTEASVQVGVGEIRLTIPRDADVEIEGEGGFLSNISAPSFEHSGKTYTHHGDGGARIRIRVQSGLGAVEVELI
jgi:hypothetical protein